MRDDARPDSADHLLTIEQAEREERDANQELDEILSELPVALAGGAGAAGVEALLRRADEARSRRQRASERRHRATLALVLTRPSR